MKGVWKRGREYLGRAITNLKYTGEEAAEERQEGRVRVSHTGIAGRAFRVEAYNDNRYNNIHPHAHLFGPFGKVTHCDGLNVYILPKFIYRNPDAQCDDVRR